MTLYEVDEAANRIREEVDPEANIIFGSTFDEKMVGLMRVSVVATGIESDTAKVRIQKYRMDRETAAQNDHNFVASDENQDENHMNSNLSDDDQFSLGRITNSAAHLVRSAQDYPAQDAAANGDAQNYPLNEHRYNELDDSEADNYQRYMAQEAPRPVKRGFFSRLAETMRGGLGREERLDPRTIEQTRRFQEEMTRFNQDVTDNTTVVDQKVQDVPAYLRRNKKS